MIYKDGVKLNLVNGIEKIATELLSVRNSKRRL